MENLYNDDLMPESFQQIAQAYSKSLKNQGFVFVSLEQEEFSLLLGEVFTILSKMKACLTKMKKQLDGKILLQKIDEAENLLQKTFGKNKTHRFECVENENQAFLSLVSLENLLLLKLMLLGLKSEQLELCNCITTSISTVFAESFSCEGFKIL